MRVLCENMSIFRGAGGSVFFIVRPLCDKPFFVALIQNIITNTNTYIITPTHSRVRVVVVCVGHAVTFTASGLESHARCPAASAGRQEKAKKFFRRFPD